MTKIGVVIPSDGLVSIWFRNIIETITKENTSEIVFIKYDKKIYKQKINLNMLYYVEKFFFLRDVKNKKRIDYNKLTLLNTYNRDIEDSEVDLILTFGVNYIPKHGYPKYGVWSYTVGGFPIENSYSGLYDQVNNEGISVSIVSNNEKGINIISQTKVKIARSFIVSRNNIMAKLPELTLQAIKMIQIKKLHLKQKNTNVVVNKNINYNILYFKLYINSLKKTFYRKIKRQTEWSLYMGKVKENFPEDSNDLVNINQPADVFWADPFLVKYKNEKYIFVEEFPFNIRKGNISVLKLDSNGSYNHIGIALERPYHLSYPFVFVYGNKHYMIPETSSNNCIELYSCEQFPLEWKFERKLLDNVTACDTTIFEHNGIWWMFTSINKNNWGFDEQLYLYYTENPITGEWKEHKMNPIVLDTRYARMAGNIIIRDGKIIRPAQDCMREYGDAIHYMNITCLDKFRYEEHLLSSSYPGYDSLGVHTYNEIDDEFIIDTRRYRG